MPVGPRRWSARGRRDRRFTQVLGAGGELLGELEDGIDEPSVLAAGPGGGSLVVIGDAGELVGFRLTRSR